MSRKALMLLLLITAGAFTVRTARLSSVPNGLFIDEAAFGYNAYSLIKTGRDEYGARWPLYIRSFYTGKNPVYMYATVASVRAFGLNAFAERLPAAVFGTLAVLFTGLLVCELFGAAAGVLAALFVAVSPWGLLISRTGTEPISLLCIATLAIWLMLLGLRKPRVAPLAGLAAGLTFYCYAPAFSFMPPFVLFFVILYRKQLKAHWKHWSAAVAIAALLLLPHFLPGVKGTEQTKYFKDNLITNPKHDTLNAALIDDMPIPFKKRIKANPTATAAAVFARNYLTSFGFTFLFRNGDTSTTRHCMCYMGTPLPAKGVTEQKDATPRLMCDAGALPLVMLPLMLAGLFAALTRPRKEHLLLLGWLVIYPLGPSMTSQWAPSAVRGIPGLPAYGALAALGAVLLLQVTQNAPARRYAAAALLLLAAPVFTYESAHSLSRYFRNYPVYAAPAWYYGMGQAVKEAARLKPRYDIAVLSHEIPYVYIFALFYLKYDPAAFQTAPLKDTGYNMEGNVGPVIVAPLRPCPETMRCLYVGRFPWREFMRPLRVIQYPDGSPALYIAEGRPSRSIGALPE